MKPFSIILLLLLLLSACKQEYTPRNISRVEIKEFTIDSTSIRAIKAFDENTMYYAGSNGTIGMTTNGGKNWNELMIKSSTNKKPNFRSIAYNKTALFALSIGNPTLLYKIPLNKIKKNTVHKFTNLFYKLVYQENHEKVFYDSMQFFENGKDGIAVGDPTENCPSIIITNDGGNTWKKIPCSQLPKFNEGEAFFAASNTNIKIIDDIVWIASGGKRSRILKSIDKGKTWEIFDTPIIQGNGPQGMYSIDFYSKNNGIAIGGDYSNSENNCKNKAITNDGGKTWTIVSDNLNPNYKSCIQYIPNTNGKEVFAVGKTGISFSNDGGLNWKEISEQPFYTIQFVNKNTAWLSGNQKVAKLTIP